MSSILRNISLATYSIQKSYFNLNIEIILQKRKLLLEIKNNSICIVLLNIFQERIYENINCKFKNNIG